MTFGPWSPGCRGHEERRLQLRTLASLVAVMLGSKHPLVGTLRLAEDNPMAFVAAREAIEALPPLTRRKILATFSAITFGPHGGGSQP